MSQQNIQITPTQSDSAPSIPAATPQANTITMKDSGATEQVKVGDKIVVQLEDGLDWNLQLSNSSVLQPAADGVFYIKATQGRYKAVAPGSVVISATGRPKCNPGAMCSQLEVAFQTTVKVVQ